jgi:hypothetical protein
VLSEPACSDSPALRQRFSKASPSVRSMILTS